MALPKGFRNNIRLTSPNIGVPRRQELLDNIADDGTFLPRGVLYQDMDETFIEFINKELNIEIDGNQVPVIFLTLQRYSEFTKTWQFTDEYKNIKIPFITIVRKPDVQVGTNYNGLYNVPGRPTFTYYKVPTNDGARVGVDVYKIPQPTSVDITYEVRLFTNKMSDLNLLNEKVQKKFQSRQAYIWPKGHPMPVMLESIGDESNIDDFENRRFYVQPFEMLLAGYILDENDFEIIPTINRAMVMSEIELADGVTTPITDPKKGGGCIVATQGSVIVRNTNNTVLSVVSCGENYVVGNSLIFNSGNTYSQLVPATTNFELPNVINIDSDGSAVLTPAMVGFTATTCQDVTIINSGATYSANTPAGSIFQLPNETINIIDSSGGTINTIQYPPLSSLNLQISGFCSPVIITNSGNTFYHSTQSGSNYELPNITHIDSNGNPVTLPAQTPFTATTCNSPSITITFYSDAGLTTPITTANYGQTIYINAVATGITPSGYVLQYPDRNDKMLTTTSQVGDTFTHEVINVGAGMYSVIADGTVVGSATLTTTVDLPITVGKFAVGYYKMVDSYTGPWALIRRYSDNATTDIGFSNGRGDLAAADAWAGELGWAVVRLYCQFGNGSTYQAIAAAQPTLGGRDYTPYLPVIGNTTNFTCDMTSGYTDNVQQTDYMVARCNAVADNQTALLNFNPNSLQTLIRPANGFTNNIFFNRVFSNWYSNVNSKIQEPFAFAQQVSAALLKTWHNSNLILDQSVSTSITANTGRLYFSGAGVGYSWPEGCFLYAHVSTPEDYSADVDRILTLLYT